MTTKETKRSIIQAGRKAVEELIKVAEEKIITNTEDDVSADRLKNAAATKKLAIFDAFEILTRIEEEERILENKPKEEKIKSLGITIKDNGQSNGVTVTKVANEDINLDIGDIILEVNREIVESIKSFTSLVEKYKETGRSSLLLKIQSGEESIWVTIKFVDN